MARTKRVNKKNESELAMLEELLSMPGRVCSFEEFLSLKSEEVEVTGKIHCKTDRGFDLICNNRYEERFAKLLLKSGLVESVRGQNFNLPFIKPWATTPAKYFPDFLVYTKDHRICIFEMKSALGMCQEENVAKYAALASFCKKRGYVYAMFDIELLTFEEYLWPSPADEISDFFYACINAQGGFNNTNLNALLSKTPAKKHLEAKRRVASLILQNPRIENRYCHDDPNLVNAVLLDHELPYKKFS